MSRIALATLCTRNWEEMRLLEEPNKAAYCQRHGYELIAAQDTWCSERPASWSKVLLLTQHLPQFDWIWWLDADTLIMDLSVPIAQYCDEAYDIVMARDLNHTISCGSFLIRNTPAALQTLYKMWEQTQFINHCWWEQMALIHLLDTWACPARVKCVEQRLFNSYHYTYQPGDFVQHFTPLHLDTRVSLMRHFLPVVQG
jgi:hypothetical protein